MMVDLTPERLQELRRIVEVAADAIERALFNNNPDAVRSAERGLRVLLDVLATQAREIERLRRGPTRESERARLVAEVGECCRGADPLCAAGCLVEAALRQRLVDKEG